MRARQLEVFVAVMRAGSITAAARMLNISQPALSQALLHAEDELGFALFTRDKGRLHPTPEAVEMLPDAERLFAGLEGLRRKTADLRQGRAGLVRIAASPPPAMAFLPAMLASYRADHPEVVLRAHVAPLAALVAMLRAAEVGLALALDDDLPPDIAAERLGGTGFSCLLPPAHRLAEQTALTLADLQDQPLISYRNGTRPHHELSRSAAAQGLQFLPQLEIDLSITAVGFVQAGLGIAVVDALLPWTQFAGIVVRPLNDTATLPLSLLTLAARPLSRAESAMAEYARSHRAGL